MFLRALLKGTLYASVILNRALLAVLHICCATYSPYDVLLTLKASLGCGLACSLRLSVYGGADERSPDNSDALQW
jgi:hypothetical protein